MCCFQSRSKPSLETEQQCLQKEVAAADKALEEAESLHNEMTDPLCSKLHQIKEDLSGTSGVRQLLFNFCDNATRTQSAFSPA